MSYLRGLYFKSVYLVSSKIKKRGNWEHKNKIVYFSVSVQRVSLHSFCSASDKKVQATIRLDLLPVPIGIVFTWRALLVSKLLQTLLTLDCFDTKVENQKHFLAWTLLSFIMVWINCASPPSQTSSWLFPAKLSSGSCSLVPVRFFTFLRVPFCASSIEEWKGGLQILRSILVSFVKISLKICVEFFCSLIVIWSFKDELEAMMGELEEEEA